MAEAAYKGKRIEVEISQTLTRIQGSDGGDKLTSLGSIALRYPVEVGRH
jgi:hypothetical protein